MLNVAYTNFSLSLPYDRLLFLKMLYFLNVIQLLVSSLYMITFKIGILQNPGQNVSKLYL
jgi:hypothetical protein